MSRICLAVIAFLSLAATVAVPAQAQQMPLRQVLAAGYEIRAVTALDTELSKQINAGSTNATTLVTLQKGTAIAVCFVSLSGYASLAQSTLDWATACDVRGADTEQYDFAGPAHTSYAGGWRLERGTGAVAFCSYARPDGSDGITACNAKSDPVPSSEDAGPFKLVEHRRPDDNSILRVSTSTGAISICYPWTENGQTRTRCTKGQR